MSKVNLDGVEEVPEGEDFPEDLIDAAAEFEEKSETGVDAQVKRQTEAEIEPELETDELGDEKAEDDRVARKMLADAPAKAAERRRIDVKEALKVRQHQLSIEERVAQLEAQAGISPIVEE